MNVKDSSFDSYRKRVIDLYLKINVVEVSELAKAIKKAVLDHKTIYILGNGGSASTASHFATDLVNIAHRRGVNLKIFSLVDSASIITAISNDIAFEDIFTVQLKSKLNIGDLVLSISVSGNSTNLINAVNYSNKVGAHTASLIGFDGGILKNISKVSCHIPSEIKEYGPVEDIHLSICHYIAADIDNFYESK